MSKLEISKLNRNDWDEFVKMYDGDYRQFYDWGELKKKFGWQVLRLEIKNNSKIISTCQLLIKKKWPLMFVYFPGSVNGEHKYVENVINYIKSRNKIYFFKYLRADLTLKENKEIILLHKKIELKKTLYKRSGSTQIAYDLEGTTIEKLKNCDRKWRYNHNRALKNPINIKVDFNPDLKLIYKLSKDLEKEKKLGNGHNFKEVTSIFNDLKDNIIYLKATDNKGQILGFRAALYYDERAWDFFAVSTKLGRYYKAGYPIMIKTIEEAQKRGVKKYYFIGDDPIKMKNVFHFKKGLNGKINEYIGETEWSNFYPIKLIINFILFLTYSSIVPKKISKH